MKIYYDPQIKATSILLNFLVATFKTYFSNPIYLKMLSFSMQSTLKIMRYFIHIFYIWFVFIIYLHLHSHISRSQQCYVNSGDVIKQYRVTIYRDIGAAAGLGTGQKKTGKLEAGRSGVEACE